MKIKVLLGTLVLVAITVICLISWELRHYRTGRLYDVTWSESTTSGGTVRGRLLGKFHSPSPPEWIRFNTTDGWLGYEVDAMGNFEFGGGNSEILDIEFRGEVLSLGGFPPTCERGLLLQVNLK